jgi:hypothetical protein
MNILRKNLLIFLCVSLFSSAILCMQEDQGESEKIIKNKIWHQFKKPSN